MKIVFIKIRQIGNKFILEDEEGNNILREKIFLDSKEEAEILAQKIRYIHMEDDDEDVDLGRGMFWDWWSNLCKISSNGNALAEMYFFDKAYQPRDLSLNEYLNYVKEKSI